MVRLRADALTSVIVDRRKDAHAPALDQAVSNEVHIFRGERYQDKNKKILSDYDTFWAAVGGECDKQGYFHIPIQIARKDESEIASKKRAEYRRRYLLLDEIQTQMSSLFGAR